MMHIDIDELWKEIEEEQKNQKKTNKIGRPIGDLSDCLPPATQRLADAIDDLGMSRKDFAERLGMSPSGFRSIFQKGTKISTVLAKAIECEFQIPHRWILDGTNTKKKEKMLIVKEDKKSKRGINWGVDSVWSFTTIDPFGAEHTYRVTSEGTEEEMIEFMDMSVRVAGFPWLKVSLQEETEFKPERKKEEGGAYESKPKDEKPAQADDDRPA